MASARAGRRALITALPRMPPPNRRAAGAISSIDLAYGPLRPAHDVPMAGRVIAAAGDERTLVRPGRYMASPPGQHLHRVLTRCVRPQPQKK